MSLVDRIIFSTDHGRLCPDCGAAVDACTCSEEATPTTSGPVRVGRETKGRKGKGVTVVSNLPLQAAELAALAKRLKKACGSGGTVRDGVIEIQGDHRDTLIAALAKEGFQAKRSGG